MSFVCLFIFVIIELCAISCDIESWFIKSRLYYDSSVDIVCTKHTWQLTSFLVNSERFQIKVYLENTSASFSPMPLHSSLNSSQSYKWGIYLDGSCLQPPLDRMDHEDQSCTICSDSVALMDFFAEYSKLPVFIWTIMCWFIPNFIVLLTPCELIKVIISSMLCYIIHYSLVMNNSN